MIIVVVYISAAMLIEESPLVGIAAMIVDGLILVVAIAVAWLSDLTVVAPALERLSRSIAIHFIHNIVGLSPCLICVLYGLPSKAFLAVGQDTKIGLTRQLLTILIKWDGDDCGLR